MKQIVRCAIYTRKSTEDGLDQEFNSLDAQREACEAYAKSQRAEGWRIIKAHYDDGGYSGGNMERPGFKKLLNDIAEGRVDLVLVYKIDRLTRSLTDFATIVDKLDQQDVSFVSVTQQFNTASSMGRLTLNMLLSFAQFEREVTGERIRDKIAASKMKGMWMGGNVPIGYKNNDKKLTIDNDKGYMIKKIFAAYIELGTVRRLKDWCDKQGYGTSPKQSHLPTTPFSRGHLYKVLSNPIYMGMIRHKDKLYEGQHEGIICKELFRSVQNQLKNGGPRRKLNHNQPLGSLLTGKLIDETGDILTPVYTIKSGKRYRYYISRRIQQDPKNSQDGWRLPAKAIEDAVQNSIINYIKEQEGLTSALIKALTDPNRLKLCLDKIDMWDEAFIKARSRAIISKVTITPGALTIHLDHTYILKLLDIGPLDQELDFIITQPFTQQKRGVEQRLIFGNLSQAQIDNALLKKLQTAQVWVNGLSDGTYSTIKDISLKTGFKFTDVSRYLPLAFLAPDIKEAIIDGKQPPSLTLESLKKVRPLPACWQEQRAILGF